MLHVLVIVTVCLYIWLMHSMENGAPENPPVWLPGIPATLCVGLMFYIGHFASDRPVWVTTGIAGCIHLIIFILGYPMASALHPESGDFKRFDLHPESAKLAKIFVTGIFLIIINLATQ